MVLRGLLLGGMGIILLLALRPTEALAALTELR